MPKRTRTVRIILRNSDQDLSCRIMKCAMETNASAVYTDESQLDRIKMLIEFDRKRYYKAFLHKIQNEEGTVIYDDWNQLSNG